MCNFRARLKGFTCLAVAAWLLACVSSVGVITPPIPTLTPASTLTPTPPSALPHDHIWIGFDGLSNAVLTVSPSGEVSTLALPLNEGQQASEMTASADGSTLAYLVWNTEGQQHGIAAWNLTEPNARLVAQPLSGYRVISLHLPRDAATLIYTEVQADTFFAEADWRLESISPQGGQPALIVSRETAPDLQPPTVIGVTEDDTLLFYAATQSGYEDAEQAIFGFAPENGQVDLVSPPEDRRVIDGKLCKLSPDGTHVIYVTSQGPLSDEPGSESSIDAARLLDLKTGQAVTLAAPGGENVTSLQWYSDNKSVLLDVTPPGPEGRLRQFWARADTSQTMPWQQTSADLARAALFSYAPYGRGVVYTLFPSETDTEWQLYVLPDIAANNPPQAIPLGPIRENTGAPFIIRAP